MDVLVPAEAEEEAKTLLVPSQPASTLPTDRAQRPVYLIGRALLALAILSIVVGLFLSYLR